MAVNICEPLYDEGEDITGHASADIVGKRLVKISANKQAGTSLVNPPGTPGTDTTGGGNVVVAHATAGGSVFGVAAHDIPSGKKGTILRGKKVLPITADGAITFGDLISVGTAGKAKTATAQTQSGTTPFAVTAGTVVVGQAIASAADGADALVALY